MIRDAAITTVLAGDAARSDIAIGEHPYDATRAFIGDDWRAADAVIPHHLCGSPDWIRR
jgi:hypothetical protein